MPIKLYSWSRTMMAAGSEVIPVLTRDKREEQEIPEVVDELILQSDISNTAGSISIGNKFMQTGDVDTGTGWILQAGERMTLKNVDPSTVYMHSSTVSLRLNCGAIKL